MKKVIDGKTYNTDTAELICRNRFGYQSDFNYIDEALYRTKKGALFVAGEGGASTHYRERTETGNYCGGEALRVLSEIDAREFVERHGDHEDYVRCFGEPAEA